MPLPQPLAIAVRRLPETEELFTLSLEPLSLEQLVQLFRADEVLLYEQPSLRGLSQESISLLPELQVSRAFLAAPGAPKHCPICLEELAAGELLRGLPCAHYLHRTCLDRWLGASGSCPVCRVQVM